jgi:dUTP pyrophosphatase
MDENETLKSLMTAIKGLADMDESTLTDEVMTEVMKGIDAQFTSFMTEQSINQIIQNFEDQGLTKTEATNAMNSLSDVLKEMIYGEYEFTGNKKVVMETIANKMFNIFDRAIEKYHSYSIKLPMTIEDGAKEPTYAHETDAAADLYAMEDQVIAAHTYGNKISTGVKIQLPEGWLAMILPRSSMGTKTPLRLSNSVGLIDSGYRGELGVLYDNTSDLDYKISAGDRIAQLLVMPSHRFQAEIVDSLEDSDRGETGFGDSGK